VKGKNRVVLNQATLCEIVENWMNADEGPSLAGDDLVKVTGVEFSMTDSTATFTVQPESEVE